MKIYKNVSSVSPIGNYHYSVEKSQQIYIFKRNVAKFLYFIIVIDGSHGTGAQSVIVSASGCGFDPLSRRWNIYLNLYFHFFSIQHAVLPESAEGGERSVLTLGSLCLPCCVRDTAWSKKNRSLIRFINTNLFIKYSARLQQWPRP